MNLCAPNFNPPLLQAALKAKVHYLDTAMTLSSRAPTDPMHSAARSSATTSTRSARVREDRRVRVAGFGVGRHGRLLRPLRGRSPLRRGRQIGVRNGSNLDARRQGHQLRLQRLNDDRGCNNPAIVYENGEVHTIEPFASSNVLAAQGIGEVEVGHVEHEEVVQIDHDADRLKGVKKATCKYALGDEFMQAIDVFHSINIDKAEKIKVGDVMVAAPT